MEWNGLWDAKSPSTDSPEELTKTSAKPDVLIKTVKEGTLPNADKHPPFREMMKPHHKAYLCQWIILNIPRGQNSLHTSTLLKKTKVFQELWAKRWI